MAHDMDFVGYLEDSLTDQERQHIETHLSACAECRAFLADMEKSIQLFKSLYSHHPDLMDPDTPPGDDPDDLDDLEDPAPSDMVPLPPEIERLLPPQKDVKTRLEQALTALMKQASPENNDLVKDVKNLADLILNSGQGPEPVWSLDRYVTMPESEGLTLRPPDEHETLSVALDDFQIEIHRQAGKNRIKVLKNRQPFEHVPITIQQRSNRKKILTTDQNGVIVF